MPTWSGVAYVAFIVDVYSRMIVARRVAAHMRTDMVLDALNMAAWNRNVDLAGLVTHSDAAQFTSIRWTERVVEIGASPSIGSVGDCLLSGQSVNGYYKAELIYGPEQGPWKTVDEVELATLAWVHWHPGSAVDGHTLTSFSGCELG